MEEEKQKEPDNDEYDKTNHLESPELPTAVGSQPRTDCDAFELGRGLVEADQFQSLLGHAAARGGARGRGFLRV